MKNKTKNRRWRAAIIVGGLAMVCLVFWQTPAGAQASSSNFILKKSTLSAAGSKGVASSDNAFSMGFSAAQESAAGKASSPQFTLYAGFWGPAVQVPVVPGDCDGTGTVSIAELQRAINMFLGTLAPACGVDCNGDGTVSIGEVQRTINVFLGTANSC